jgi:hypothetical protein
VGIGFGAEMTVTDETVTVTGSGYGPYTGVVSNCPIKPGSFRMIEENTFGEVEFWDNGDGTIDSLAVAFDHGTINYTSGVCTRYSKIDATGLLLGHTVNYTAYEFDVTPDGLATNTSGMLSGDFTIPAIWNGTHTITVIDEEGNVATSDFEVYGSDIVPEPLTLGAVVLLSSAALIASFYCLRKRS